MELKLNNVNERNLYNSRKIKNFTKTIEDLRFKE